MFSWPLIGNPFKITESLAVVGFRAHELVLVVWCRSRASTTAAILQTSVIGGAAQKLWGQGPSTPGELGFPMRLHGMRPVLPRSQ
jgi:hypothetical protein